MIRFLVFALCLAWALPAQAQTFTRGQWTQHGTGTTAGAHWVSTGVEKDVFGSTIPAGQAVCNFFNENRCGEEYQIWDSAVFDTTRGRYVITVAGGHGSFMGNEVNEFDVASGTWNPDGRPMNPTTALLRSVTIWTTHLPVYPATPGAAFPPGADTGDPQAMIDTVGTYSANVVPDHQSGLRIFPLTRHNYGALIYMPSVKKILSLAGVGEGSGAPKSIPAEWDPATKKWEVITPDQTFSVPLGNGSNMSTSWDSRRNRVLVIGGEGLLAYLPTAAQGSRVVVLANGYMNSNALDYQQSLYDPKRDRVVFFNSIQLMGNGSTPRTGYWTLDHTTGNPVGDPVLVSPTGDLAWVPGPGTGNGPGALYDPIADKYVVWIGLKTLYYIDPDTWVSTAVTPSGGATPGNPGTLIWNRFFYMPATDTYGTISTAFETGMSIYAPTRPPVLAFTDMTQGPKSGNTDTSQGQSSGVNGAVVTVWGYNLVGATFTINGVAPAATYYTGNAVPPACGAANLFNGYHKLQCAILQVASTASTGAGTIVATAGGFTSNTLPFTVKTGNICFAATGGTATGACGANGTFAAPYGSIQTMLDNMARNDIGYIRNGLSATSGVDLPTPATGACAGQTLTDAFMVVAYPGAAVQVGNATNVGFKQPHACTGFGVTYSKMTVYGDSGGAGISVGDWGRVVGTLITAPNMNSVSGTGCTGGFGSDLFFLGNELTACSNVSAANSLDHVIYLFGRRGLGSSTFAESRREVAWNYLHDNPCPRGVNSYNGEPGGSNPITDHRVHDNVILNQTWAGIGFLYGTSGDNWAWNNLCINCGIDPSPGNQVALQMRAGCDTGNNGTACTGLVNVFHIAHNTWLNSGLSSGGSAAKGAWEIGFPSSWAADWQNNLTDQEGNGLPYLATGGSSAPGSGTVAKNLWYGAGAAPGMDSAPVAANPQLVSAVSTYNLHLQGNSPAIQAGANTPSYAPYDFDGLERPVGAPADIGAYQFAGSGGAPSPPPGTTSSTLTGKGVISGKSVLR